MSQTAKPRTMSFSARTVAEVGLILATFVVLDYLAVRLPINIAGGSISFAMLPIMLYAVVRGPVLGAFTGALAGTLDMMVQPFFVHPVQIALDYSVAYAVVGLGAGLFSAAIWRASRAGRTVDVAVLVMGAGVVAGLLRLAVHFTSGVIFFGSYAPAGQAVWVYSLLYNLTYIGPSALISTIVVRVVAWPVLRSVGSTRS